LGVASALKPSWGWFGYPQPHLLFFLSFSFFLSYFSFFLFSFFW
jgi:hypothetical protein